MYIKIGLCEYASVQYIYVWPLYAWWEERALAWVLTLIFYTQNIPTEDCRIKSGHVELNRNINPGLRTVSRSIS